MRQPGLFDQRLWVRQKWLTGTPFLPTSFEYPQILLMQGNVEDLAGIYSLAFLGVMSTFTIGCIFLKAGPAGAGLVEKVSPNTLPLCPCLTPLLSCYTKCRSQAYHIDSLGNANLIRRFAGGPFSAACAM
jgi:hypothetical protein